MVDECVIILLAKTSEKAHWSKTNPQIMSLRIPFLDEFLMQHISFIVIFHYASDFFVEMISPFFLYDHEEVFQIVFNS